MSKRADGNLESKSLGRGGFFCNGRKLVSAEGGDCWKRNVFVFPFLLRAMVENTGESTPRLI